jgi:predicted permease
VTLRGLLTRVRGYLRAQQSDRDLRDQIDAHLEEAIEEHVRRGLSPADARRAALLEFGSVVQAEESYRDVRGRWLQDVTKDVRYGLRSLGRSPAFATIAVLSLAVGIGANTAIFSIINAMVLRPRAVADPGNLVELYVGDRQRPYETCSYPSYIDFRDRNGVFSGLAAYGISQFRLTDPDRAEQVWGEVVSANYFDVLGVPAYSGRMFGEDVDRVPGSEQSVVISYGLWQRRFDADPSVIGRTMAINGQTLTVVAVAPPEYTGMMRGLASELWIPAAAMPLLEPSKGRSLLNSRGSRWLVLVGRLAPGVSVERARTRFELLSREMQATQPDEWKSKQQSGAIRELFVSVVREHDTRIHPDMHADAYAAVALVVAVVNVVLAIACMNLANMLLARGVVRRKELAIRLALGAGRWRLIRQLMIESLLLALVAGAAGVVLTVWLIHLLLAFMPALPEGIRLALDLRLDWRVLAYTLAFSTITGLLFGLVPALRSSRPDVTSVLKDDAAAVTGSYHKSRSRRALVVIQVACSLLLLIAAGLLLRSLDNVRPTRLGFSSENVLVASLSLDPAQYDRQRSQEFYRQLSERVAAVPGVTAVSLVEGMPGGFMGRTRRGIEIEGYRPAPGESLEIDSIVVGPRYFTTMRVPIVQGRDFDERDRDGAPCVAIVNEVFGRRYFSAAGSPLGRHVARYTPTGSTQACEIVGVIRDDRWQSLEKTVRPFFALAVLQSYQRRMSLLVHTEGDPAVHTNAVRRTVLQLDRQMPVHDVHTLRDYFGVLLYPFRLLAVVIAGCGVMALLLATIGIYGVVSYSAAQRTREVGIRMALGALRSDILRMVVGQGIVMVVIGLVLGLVLSVALTRVLTSAVFETELLYGVSPTDIVTFAVVTILLALVAVVACYVPARQAAKVDPIEALRYE